jgi:hypothetical protein
VAGCYQLPPSPLTLEEAGLECEGLGGGLAEIEGSEKQAAILQHLGTEALQGRDLWLPLRVVEGAWKWLSGRLVGAGWNNWAVGQPDGPEAAGDCAALTGPEGRWAARPCAGTLYTLCQKGGSRCLVWLLSSCVQSLSLLCTQDSQPPPRLALLPR